MINSGSAGDRNGFQENVPVLSVLICPADIVEGNDALDNGVVEVVELGSRSTPSSGLARGGFRGSQRSSAVAALAFYSL